MHNVSYGTGQHLSYRQPHHAGDVTTRRVLPADLPTRRFRLLLSELAKSEGSLTKAAKKLGITQATASFIRNGDRAAGGETIQKAIKALSLESDFFYSAELGEAPAYRDHVKGRTASTSSTSEVVYAALDDFVELRKTQKRPITEERYEQLRAARWKGVKPTVQTYVLLDKAIDEGVPVDEAAAEEELTEAHRASARAKGMKVKDTP